MKKLLLSSGLFIQLLVVNAQDTSPVLTIQNSATINFSNNGNTLTLSNASVSTDKLTVFNAEKIVMDKAGNKLEIYGPSRFSFKGKVIINEKSAEATTKIEYILGKDELYFK